ncbi:MAG: type II toxin-antitoxin system Phd/YefM family antitoxin [Planctomycetota bacterium]
MANISAEKARAQFSDVIKRVEHDRERIIITRKGKKVAALITVEDFEWFEEMEDREDVEDAKKALAEPGEDIPWEKVKAEPGKSIPLEQVKRDLGL